jgi:hypothetical protein
VSSPHHIQAADEEGAASESAAKDSIVEYALNTYVTAVVEVVRSLVEL